MPAHFYMALQRNETPSEALRAAQLAMLNDLRRDGYMSRHCMAAGRFHRRLSTGRDLLCPVNRRSSGFFYARMKRGSSRGQMIRWMAGFCARGILDK
jgi:CHAT domain-containing protein